MCFYRYFELKIVTVKTRLGDKLYYTGIITALVFKPQSIDCPREAIYCPSLEKECCSHDVKAPVEVEVRIQEKSRCINSEDAGATFTDSAFFTSSSILREREKKRWGVCEEMSMSALRRSSR